MLTRSRGIGEKGDVGPDPGWIAKGEGKQIFGESHGEAA